MKQIIFVGNGPYLNRGCEAIIRGTLNILSDVMTEPYSITNLVFASREVAEWQNEIDKDLPIQHLSLQSNVNPTLLKNYMHLYSRSWSYAALVPALRRLMKRLPAFNGIFELIRNADLIMDIGGDNLTFDYCFPANFFCLDDQIRQIKKCPHILWGASMGDLNKRSAKQQNILIHQLSQFDHLFIRESMSCHLLNQNRITQVSHMLDPAFAMAAEAPSKSLPVLPQTIGLNLSPMLGRYAQGGISEWPLIATELIKSILRRFPNPLLLIPHVSAGHFDIKDPYFCDAALMEQIYGKLDSKDKNRVCLLPSILTAQELKWYISQCYVFAGARTHATIAAFSSYVPTLSFSYSLKARGINQDLYDHLDYCIDSHNLTADRLICKIETLLEKRDRVHEHLAKRIPLLRENSMRVWESLHDFVQSSRNEPAPTLL